VPIASANAALLSAATRRIFADIREDYVVSIDVDEYWVMPKGIPTFASLVAADRFRADIYYADWVMIPNDGWDVQAPPYRAFHVSEHKWMARTGAVNQIDSHEPELTAARVATKRYGQGECWHFWGRTFLDQLLKGATGNGTNKGGEGALETLRLLDSGLLPQRMKLLAFLAVYPGAGEGHEALLEVAPPSGAPLVRAEKALELLLLAGALNRSLDGTQEVLGRVHRLYASFKACLARREDLPVYRAGVNLMAIATYLDACRCNGGKVLLLNMPSNATSVDDLD